MDLRGSIWFRESFAQFLGNDKHAVLMQFSVKN